jgi:hypothetical protein
MWHHPVPCVVWRRSYGSLSISLHSALKRTSGADRLKERADDVKEKLTDFAGRVMDKLQVGTGTAL